MELLILTTLYGLTVAVFVLLLAWVGLSRTAAVVLGFLLFSLLSGLLAAWAWPMDSCTYANVYAVLLGDEVYVRAISLIGDPYADDAHSTIPWLLRVPQVYVPASLVLSGLANVPAAWLWGRGVQARRH